jgi:hypothetical protein
MTHFLSQYSLTSYTDFRYKDMVYRKLEFEYTKIKDENEELQAKL